MAPAPAAHLPPQAYHVGTLAPPDVSGLTGIQHHASQLSAKEAGQYNPEGQASSLPVGQWETREGKEPVKTPLSLSPPDGQFYGVVQRHTTWSSGCICQDTGFMSSRRLWSSSQHSNTYLVLLLILPSHALCQ